MPKLLVGLISAAFALVIGFGSGALLTVPENRQMENILNNNKVAEKKITDLELAKNTLEKKLRILQEKNQLLEEKLLNSFEAKEKSREKLLESYRNN